MDERTKLMLAFMQVNNIVELTKDNQWKEHLYRHLSSIKYEIERKLTNLNHSDKMKANHNDQ